MSTSDISDIDPGVTWQSALSIPNVYAKVTVHLPNGHRAEFSKQMRSTGRDPYASVPEPPREIVWTFTLHADIPRRLTVGISLDGRPIAQSRREVLSEDVLGGQATRGYCEIRVPYGGDHIDIERLSFWVQAAGGERVEVPL